MIDINNWLGVRENKQKDIRCALNTYNEYLDRDWQNKNVSFCFLSISDNGKYILICIHKKDKEEDVEHGIRRYNKAIEDNMNVFLYNYQNNKFKKWNRFSKQESEGDIGLVDYDSLIEVIKEIQNINNPLFLKAKKFNRFFYAVIYKLLKEGIFGVENNDMTLRDFADKMHLSGLNSVEKSTLSEHMRKLAGKSPRIYIIQNDMEKSQETLNTKIKCFVEEIISRYLCKSHKTA